MPQKLISRNVVLGLIVAAPVLLVTLTVVLALGAVLNRMGDAAAGCALYWIAVGLAVPLVVDLFLLLMAVALNSLAEPEEPAGQDRGDAGQGKGLE